MKLLLAGGVLILTVLVGARLVSAPAPKVAQAPALVGTDWINGKAAEFKGHITIIHFWTFECINCQHNLPYIQKWAEKYDPKEVQVIGIHTPELEEEKDTNNVKAAVERLGIKYPVLIDGKGENWNRYGVEAWPTVVLIDKEGRIRSSWTGELQWNGQNGFGELTQKVERLWQEKE